MPNIDPPFDLDAYAIIRDKNRQKNYPSLLLRGIYDMMERYKGEMHELEAFMFAHNCVVMSLVKKAKKPRFNAKDGFLQFTSTGYQRESEVRGWRKLSDETQKGTGYKLSRQKMKTDTDDKLKELDIILNRLIPKLPNAPPQQPGSNLV